MSRVDSNGSAGGAVNESELPHEEGEPSGANEPYFPEEEEVGEGKQHLRLRTLLYEFLTLAFSDHAAIGCDQFVYWDATDPRHCLCPDAFVRLGVPDDEFKVWKVWERGEPQVAVEVISQSDRRDNPFKAELEKYRPWRKKMQRYQAVGVQELVRFDPERGGGLLRVWERTDGQLVEQTVVGGSFRSRCLPGFWVVVHDARFGPTLRLSHDAAGERLYPTRAELEAEARQREAEARQREAEARQREAEARQRAVEAERRVRELEEELRRRGG